MRITFNLPQEKLYTADFSNDTLISGLLMSVALETGIPEQDIILTKDRVNIHTDRNKTILEIPLVDGDLVNVQRQNVRSPLQGITPHNDLPVIDFASINLPNAGGRQVHSMAEVARQQILSAPPAQRAVLRDRNPELIDAINDQETFARLFDAQRSRVQRNASELSELENADPFDPRIQERIAQLIQQQNIDREMENAMEYYPETFGQVIMLYVNCELNEFHVKAFVDSGAQTTIMSLQCAERCNLRHLIDNRWSGMAVGVGTQKIIGRIHQAQLKFGEKVIPSSFVVLENQPMELMIGLDMLKRHRCCIDLGANVLKIGEHTTVPFLSENELPESARHQDLPTSSENSLTHEQQEKLTLLTSQNVPFERALKLLKDSDWNADIAMVKFVSSNFS